MAKPAEISTNGAGNVKWESVTIEFSTETVEGKTVYVAYCRSLDLAASGNSMDEAEKSIEQTISMFLAAITDKGTIEEVLTDCGWTRIEGPNKKPMMVPPKITQRTITLEPVACK